MTNTVAVATLRPAARIIYLRVDPATAVTRMGSAVESRPLLAGPDPRSALEALLERRRVLYASADHALDTEALSVAEVAESLVEMLRDLERGDG